MLLIYEHRFTFNGTSALEKFQLDISACFLPFSHEIGDYVEKNPAGIEVFQFHII